jgi:hypothetical protein
VRIHRQKVADGPQDHVKHRSRADSQSCQGDEHVEGTPLRSSRPVE